MAEWSTWRETNRAMWDDRVPVHVGSDFYDVEGFLADDAASTLRPFEVEEVGPVEGLDLLHLQCHFGLDTLSWARLGARVVGLDFSEPAVAAARDLATRAGLADRAEFVASDVYDAAAALGGRRFDVVYTGLGAIGWLPDIERWAGVVSSLVRPGGLFYLAEFHPFSWVFADETLAVEYPYFHRDEPFVFEDEGSYADADARFANNRTYEWHHGFGEVINALLAAGLHLERVHEHDYTLFQRWPFLEAHDGEYRLPASIPSLPLMYSLRARKPVG